MGKTVDGALAGTLSISAIVVLVQGLFGMASLADQDGDVWIENGAVPAPDVLAFEQAAAPYIQPTAVRSLVHQRPTTDIHFEGIRFGYPGRDSPVYDGLDLRIAIGQSLAIVGRNGAGRRR